MTGPSRQTYRWAPLNGGRDGSAVKVKKAIDVLASNQQKADPNGFRGSSMTSRDEIIDLSFLGLAEKDG